MKRLLINNVEQRQPDERSDTLFELFARDKEEDLYRVTVYGFDPHFYALKEEVKADEDYLVAQDCIDKIQYGDFEGLDGEELARVVVPYPQDTREARELFSEHWSADVPFTNRFRIDSGLRAVADFPEPATGENHLECHWHEIKPLEPDSPDANPGGQTSETPLQNVDPRVVTVDIEADDRNGFPEDGQERILSIVTHDSYTDETRGFYDLDGRDEAAEFPDGAPDGIDALTVTDNEVEMLDAFAEWFNEKDPDLVSGWNSNDFDIPFIIERFDELNENPDRLSRLGWSGFSRGEPRMKGRSMYDLLTVYKKNRFTELRSYSLDYVAGEELDAEKIQFEGTYFDLYQDDPETFMEYNAADVNLTVGINEEAGVIEFRDILRREVGVDFEDSFDNKDFVDMMCRRKLKDRGLIGPSRPAYGEEPESDYEGALVLDPYEGVAQNVVGIDLASLYPYTMAMLNASPETKVGGVTNDFTVELTHPDGSSEREIPACIASNDQGFQLAEDGLFKELVDDAISLKSEYKRLRDSAETDEEYETWEEKYNVAKTLTNSLYGVTGWERFFLYDEAVAEAVTLTGQTVIKRTAEYVEETGYEVLYGDTDSTYIKFPDDWTREECLDTARELCQDLNETIYPELAESIGIPTEDNLWEIEVEAFMESFFQAGKKKRYAYLATWKDGREVEEPKPSISGFSSRRSDSAKLTVETEKKIFDAILSGETEDVNNIVFEAAKQIRQEDPDWDLIGIPGGMNKAITDNPRKGETDEYYAVSTDDDGNTYPQDAHPRAVYNANQILDATIGSDDKPKRIYLREKYYEEVGRRIDVIAFENSQQIESSDKKFRINVPRMTETILVNPLEETLDAIDVDVRAASKGQTQTGLGSFT